MSVGLEESGAVALASGYGGRRQIRVERVGVVRAPVVDLRGAESEDPGIREALAAGVATLCREFGYFYIEHHGIAEQTLAEARDEIEQFFDLPLAEKNRIHISKSPHHRGYVPCGEEHAFGTAAPDLKEVFDIARELPADHPDVRCGKPFHGPNVWPQSRAKFRVALQGLYDDWLKISARINTLFALGLGLPEQYFAERSHNHLCQLRIVKYPPQPARSISGQIGCGEHTDYGIVSILWQIDRPGLEILGRDGQWLDVPIIPGTFVCILGDMIGRWTNDAWRSTRHRVVNDAIGFRHSAAFFFDPDYDCEVEPLPHFVSAQNPSRYTMTTMGAHMARGFDGSFSYRVTDKDPPG